MSGAVRFFHTLKLLTSEWYAGDSQESFEERISIPLRLKACKANEVGEVFIVGGLTMRRRHSVVFVMKR
jgi:hypothetical protein